MKVLVLDGNENQAVACVRSLTRAGHLVWVGASNGWSKAGWSRFCSATFSYPSPERDTERFVRRVTEEVCREAGTLVLPLTDRTTLPLSERRDQILSAGGRLVLPPHDILSRALDKYQMTRLAESLGIAVPYTLVIEDSCSAAAIAKSFIYPALLKPRSSQEVSTLGSAYGTGRPVYARNAEEFLAAYARLRTRCSAVVVQEFVEGRGAGYFVLMRHGDLRAEFAHLRIRDVHPTGSGSALRVSIDPNHQLRTAGLAILRALRWHGVAMAEFRLRADGSPVFLEVNGRFWNSLPLAVYAGADFPALLAHLAEHGDVDAARTYRLGVRCRWLLGDFRHLIAVWRGAPACYPGRFPGRMRTLLDLLLPVPRTYHDNFRLDDPLPEVGDWLNFLLQRFPDTIKNRRAVRGDLSAQRRSSHP